MLAAPAWSQILDSGPRAPRPQLPPLATGPETAAPQQQQQPAPVRPAGGEFVLSPEASPQQPLGALETAGRILPFGAQLFAPAAPSARAIGINPAYVIAPGDKISVQMWGATTFADVLTVDLQGNVFLPDIGPVRVAGATLAQLDPLVNRAVARVYTDRVQVYTNLLGTQPIGVYVTGAVPRPGRFAGERTDSALYYLGQAGGVDLRRGSFRDIRVLRGGQTLIRIDLYDFLLRGQLPPFLFQDNDTIIVGPQQPLITVAGEVRNTYSFEIPGGLAAGAAVVEMAAPLPRVSHVGVRGVRGGLPYNAYVGLREFAQGQVSDGDALVFQSDLVDDIIFVGIVGQGSGPSSFAVPRGTRLSQVLDMIAVDPRTANTQDIYLRRKSIAERQKRALEVALDQLQRAVLTTQSATASEADIRIQEAQLVERFIAKARTVEPEGRVVLASRDALSDVLMEADDVVVIPQKSDLVIISGEINIPQSLVFRPGLTATAYVDASGGFTDRADTASLLVIRQSGEIAIGGNPEVRPGDQIMVMPSAGSKTLAVFKDVVEIMFRIAVSAGTLIRLTM